MATSHNAYVLATSKPRGGLTLNTSCKGATMGEAYAFLLLVGFSETFVRNRILD